MRWRVPPGDGTSGEPDGRAALDALAERFPALLDPAATPLVRRFAAGEVVDAEGRPWAADALVAPGDELWFHRELRAEDVPPAELRILHQDEHLLVIDKPHDMATMPRGIHVLSSALVRLRRATGIAALVPLHRLDRRTAGVLAFGIRPEERSAYQQLFARGQVDKEYEARVLPGPGASLPTTPGQRLLMRDHLIKRRGEMTARVLPGEPNAETALEVLSTERAVGDGAGPAGPPESDVELGGDALRVRLRPRTGRTHQLRAQLADRGAPILGEDLYWPAPRARPAPELWPEGLPLQLLARGLAFVDPFTGARREFRSGQELGRGPGIGRGTGIGTGAGPGVGGTV